MKSVLIVLSLVGMVGLSMAMIRCTEDICSRVRCASVTEAECLAQPQHRYDPKGGFCHCCPACIAVHQINEDCYDTMILGPVKRSECAPGLHCDTTSHKCVPNQA